MLEQKPIHVRAWEGGRMHYDLSYITMSGGAMGAERPLINPVLMFWTGITDKAQKKIYEWDVVTCPGMYDEETGQTEITLCVVQMIASSVALVEYSIVKGEQRVDVEFLHDIIGGGVDHDPELEVIGNVWENPELVDKLPNGQFHESRVSKLVSNLDFLKWVK